MKPFDELDTITIAKLTSQEIEEYMKVADDPSEIMNEVANCKKILKNMGMNY